MFHPVVTQHFQDFGENMHHVFRLEVALYHHKTWLNRIPVVLILVSTRTIVKSTHQNFCVLHGTLNLQDFTRGKKTSGPTIIFQGSKSVHHCARGWSPPPAATPPTQCAVKWMYEDTSYWLFDWKKWKPCGLRTTDLKHRISTSFSFKFQNYKISVKWKNFRNCS